MNQNPVARVLRFPLRADAEDSFVALEWRGAGGVNQALTADIIGGLGLFDARLPTGENGRVLVIRPFDGEYYLSLVDRLSRLPPPDFNELEKERKRLEKELDAATSTQKTDMLRRKLLQVRNTIVRLQRSRRFLDGTFRSENRIAQVLRGGDGPALHFLRDLPQRIAKFDAKAKVFRDELIHDLQEKKIEFYQDDRENLYVTSDLPAAVKVLSARLTATEMTAHEHQKQKIEMHNVGIKEQWKVLARAVKAQLGASGDKETEEGIAREMEACFSTEGKYCRFSVALEQMMEEGGPEEVGAIRHVFRVRTQIKAFCDALGISKPVVSGSSALGENASPEAIEKAAEKKERKSVTMRDNLVRILVYGRYSEHLEDALSRIERVLKSPLEKGLEEGGPRRVLRLRRSHPLQKTL